MTNWIPLLVVVLISLLAIGWFMGWFKGLRVRRLKCKQKLGKLINKE